MEGEFEALGELNNKQAIAGRRDGDGAPEETTKHAERPDVVKNGTVQQSTWRRLACPSNPIRIGFWSVRNVNRCSACQPYRDG